MILPSVVSAQKKCYDIIKGILSVTSDQAVIIASESTVIYAIL